MTTSKSRHLKIDSPLELQNAIDAIAPGKCGYLTFKELQLLTGQTCQEFVDEHHKIRKQPSRITFHCDDDQQRLYICKAASH